ncbi:hypothetical protein RB597_002788 [Gaeumannomyces tritici]
MKFSTISSASAALLLLPQLVSAHYLFPHFILNDKVSKPQEFTREHDNGFMPLKTPEILTSDDIRCNKGSMNHRTQPKTAKIKAGQDTVGFKTAVGNVFHPGPITIMMSKAPGSIAEYDGSGSWFKVFEMGTKLPWNGKDDGWLTKDKDRFTFKLTDKIPAGEYLMRIEHMAVHQPFKQKELYIMCAHVEVESSYTGPEPGPTIKLPGGYKTDDKAFGLDSWANPPPKEAFAPGPALWPGGGGGGDASANDTQPAAPPAQAGKQSQPAKGKPDAKAKPDTKAKSDSNKEKSKKVKRILRA